MIDGNSDNLYAELELKVGLEIHQQLLTERKLFCHCPAALKNCRHDAEVLRHMRPTLSELGEYDGTALMEFKTRKNVLYEIFSDVDCTYEMDDTPPFLINQEALDVALQIALLLNLNIVDEMHISRKQYLDGSIPTGFQRTAIVGVEGWVPYPGNPNRRIGIIQLGLEEDACREVSDQGHMIVFKADRLGIPLVEVVTHADMHTPDEVSVVASMIWRLLRITGRVRRGPGATRMDVNVSIDGSNRCEIKGVPNTRVVRKLVHNETLRHRALLEIREILRQRGITRDTLQSRRKNLTAVLRQTQNSLLRRALSDSSVIRGVRLTGFAGLLNYPTQPGRPFAYELSERVRVIACLDQLPNLIYRGCGWDEGITGDEWRQISHQLEAKHGDEVILVWGSALDTRTAAEELIIRAKEATESVPKETRQANKDGTTGFERILPGPDRMYPDTDSPPTVIDRRRLKTIAGAMPEPIWVTEQRYRDLGLPDDVVASLPLSRFRSLFERLVGELKITPVLAGVVLEQQIRALGRAGADVSRLTEDDLFALFARFQAGQFHKEAFPIVLKRLTDGTPLDQVLQRLGLTARLNPSRTRRTVEEALGKPPKCQTRNPKSRLRYCIGLAMRHLRGKADGRLVKEAVDAILSSERKPARAKPSRSADTPVTLARKTGS